MKTCRNLDLTQRDNVYVYMVCGGWARITASTESKRMNDSGDMVGTGGRDRKLTGREGVDEKKNKTKILCPRTTQGR